MILLTTILTTLKNFVIGFFKQNWRSIAIEILCVIVIVLFLIIKYRSTEPKVVYVNTTNQLDSLPQKKDENGQIYELLNEVALNRDQLQTQVDSLSKALKVAKSDVRTVTNVVTKTVVKDSNIAVQTPKVNIHSFVFLDKYVDLSVLMNDTTDKAEFSLSTIDTLSILETLHKPFLGLGQTTHEIYLRNKNPYNHINDGNSYTVKEKPIFITIGPDIQYNPFTNKISIGISIQKPLIKIR
jgi:hypothetical protein